MGKDVADHIAAGHTLNELVGWRFGPNGAPACRRRSCGGRPTSKPAAQPRWLAKDRLPRAAVTLLIGDEGIGKSLLWVLDRRPRHHRKTAARVRHPGPRPGPA